MPIIHLDTDKATRKTLREAADALVVALNPRRCQRRWGTTPSLVQCPNIIAVTRRSDARYCSRTCRGSERSRRRHERAATLWSAPAAAPSSEAT